MLVFTSIHTHGNWPLNLYASFAFYLAKAQRTPRAQRRKKGEEMLFDKISFNKMIFERITIISHTTTLFSSLGVLCAFASLREE